MTSDDYALATIAEGKRLGITPRGIQIALAVELVETNLTMYANSNDPASLQLPHDAVGSDHMSSGLFQQQPSWGTLANRMDPTASANIFFTVDNGPGVRGLIKIRDPQGILYDYNDISNTPGFYAQTVQGSAFPDRYDQRFNDAVTLYNRLVRPPDSRLVLLQAARPDFNEIENYGPNSEGRAGTAVDCYFRHTEQSSGYDNALGLSNFLIASASTNNPVSYHYTLSKGQNDDGVTVVDCIDTDLAAWAVGNSNLRSINSCYAGSDIAWTRQEWIDNLGRCIDVLGYLTVQDWIKYGGVGAPPMCAGPAYGLNPPVVSDHRYCTDWLKDGNTHTDVGDNYPWDLDAAAVAKYWVIATAATPPVIVPPAPIPVPVPLIPVPVPSPLSAADVQAGPWPQLAGDPAALNVLRANIAAKTPLTLVDAVAGFLYGFITPLVPVVKESEPMNKARMVFKAGAPVAVTVKPGPVTWRDDLKKYWHLAITVVGLALMMVNEFSPIVTDATMKQYVTVVIAVLTAAGVFLKSNENWVDSVLTPTAKT